MPFSPRISKGTTNFSRVNPQFSLTITEILEDDLHAIIYLPALYYKSKYVRWGSYYCFTYGSLYLCLLFYNMIMRPEKVIVLDLLIGGLSAEVNKAH